MNTIHKRNQVDTELARVLKDRVKWDKRVSIADLEIVVRGGVVIVSGFVDTSFKKNAAIDVICDTEGVWEIEDRIIVPSDYYRTDNEIKEVLEHQIDAMVKLGGEHIEISVTDGLVRLKGEVFRPRLKAMAVIAAWELSGVHDVFNFIEIKDPPQRITLGQDNQYQDRFRESGTWPSDANAEANLKEVS